MLDFTWKVFCMTGSVDTYLLMKEMESGDINLQSPPTDENMNQESSVETTWDDPNE